MATREATPPPVIGKAGPYTVFITPSATPRPSEGPRSENLSHKCSPSSLSSSPREKTRSSLSGRGGNSSPTKGIEKPAAAAPPPVQVPPPQFEKSRGGKGSKSVLEFFWDAVVKVQDAHSSLDQYLANWLGLDQSRYQWALNDYYENSGAGKVGGKPKEHVGKGQAV